MEGHQLDSESDIRNKQKKKHIRKRTSNRVLTDAITNELKRLSDLNDCNGPSQYTHERYFTKNIKEVYINNFKNCLAEHQNIVPRKIIVYVPTARHVSMEYLSNTFLNKQREIFQVSSSKKDNERALMLPQNKNLRNYLMMRRREDEWCSCSGIDITRLFIFAKIMYEISQQLRRLATKPVAQDSAQCNIYTISVELANLRKLLNPMPGYDGVIRLIRSHPTHEMAYQTIHKPFARFDTHEKSIKFKISIEKHSMRFNITTSRINVFSRQFLQALETFFSVSKTAKSYEANCNVPSLSIRNWHFHNILQGYLLGILLRNINVNTLNMMRNLYFVIITCSASNFMIEIIIKLKSGIFMVYDNLLYQEVINWNESHQMFIKKSVSMATLENAIQKRYLHMHNRKRQLNIIAHKGTKLQQSNPNIGRPRNYHINAENEEDSGLDDYYSDSESLQTKTSEVSAITLPQRNRAALVLQQDETAGESNPLQSQETGGGSIINNIFFDNRNMYSSNFLHSKKWLTKVSNGSNSMNLNGKVQKQNSTDIFKFNTLRESIFDRTTLQRHIESVTYLCWKQVTSNSFHMVFLKSLGQSIANIFFSVVI